MSFLIVCVHLVYFCLFFAPLRTPQLCLCVCVLKMCGHVCVHVDTCVWLWYFHSEGLGAVRDICWGFFWVVTCVNLVLPRSPLVWFGLGQNVIVILETTKRRRLQPEPRSMQMACRLVMLVALMALRLL